MGALLALLFAFAVPALAQAPESAADESWAYALWHDTMSPYCPGRTLAECPSPQADQLRLWILGQAAAGATREQVQETLFERFGDQILTTPRAEGGWGLAAYAIPVVGFVLGGCVVFWALRRMAGPGERDSGDELSKGPAIDPEIRRQIEKELRA